MDEQINNQAPIGQQPQQNSSKLKKDPVKMAMRNYKALSFIYIVVGLLFSSTKPVLSYFFIPAGIFLLVVAYFLSKKMKIGM